MICDSAAARVCIRCHLESLPTMPWNHCQEEVESYAYNQQNQQTWTRRRQLRVAIAIPPRCMEIPTVGSTFHLVTNVMPLPEPAAVLHPVCAAASSRALQCDPWVDKNQATL